MIGPGGLLQVEVPGNRLSVMALKRRDHWIVAIKYIL